MTLLTWLIFLPVLFALAAYLLPRPQWILWLSVIGSLVVAVNAGLVAASAWTEPVFAQSNNLFVDSLSTFHIIIVAVVFAFSSIYAKFYFEPHLADESFDINQARRFGGLWFLFLAAILFTLITNNIGLMWVGLEATTVFSALLVGLRRDEASVRSAWIYLILCSVAIALALLGVLIVCAEAQTVGATGSSAYLWTKLLEIAPLMHSGPLQLAFLFAFVGFGTKAGLAPMHSWLPEAHSQAPTPVSAVLSSVLLNTALYCLSRFLPILEPAAPGWALKILIPFGLISVWVAAVFMLHERDIKRLLAYCSVEHMGIIALGLGFGVPAAALFHTLNHSLAKMTAFFSAGALVQRFGTREMALMGKTLRVMPGAGAGFLFSLLALIGTPPFAVLISELWIAQAGLGGGHVVAVTFFLVGIALIYVAVFRHAVKMTWSNVADPKGHDGRVPVLLMALPLLVLVVLSFWIAPEFRDLLNRAASVIGGAP